MKLRSKSSIPKMSFINRICLSLWVSQMVEMLHWRKMRPFFVPNDLLFKFSIDEYDNTILT